MADIQNPTNPTEPETRPAEAQQAAQQTPAAQTKSAPPAAAATQQPPAAKPEKPQDIGAAILAAVEAAASKKGKTVVKSMAEQYDLTDEEAQAALDEAKAKKAKQLPPEVQAKIDAAVNAANDRLVAAEVKSVGVTMGLLDADAALLLMKRDGVKVDADGKVTGVKEALEALKTDKSYLFKTAESTEPKPTGEKKDVGGKVDAGGGDVDLAQFRRMGYGSRARLKQENPTLYASLTEQERKNPQYRKSQQGA